MSKTIEKVVVRQLPCEGAVNGQNKVFEMPKDYDALIAVVVGGVILLPEQMEIRGSELRLLKTVRGENNRPHVIVLTGGSSEVTPDAYTSFEVAKLKVEVKTLREQKNRSFFKKLLGRS